MNPETLAMFEKLIRAKVKLENAKQSHSPRCIIEMDPTSYAPCDCGASSINSIINDVLEELK